MSGEIICFGATGQNNYFQIRSTLSAEIANGTGLEAYNQAHWSNYVVSSSEQAGSGGYVAGIPGYLPAGPYRATLYTVLGGSPASGDTPISTTEFDWDGGTIIYGGTPVNVGQINGSASAAENLAILANVAITGEAMAGTLTSTQMTTNLVITPNQILDGRVLMFTSGVNQGLAALITAYLVTGGKITYIAYNNLPAPAAPSATDTFVIL